MSKETIAPTPDEAPSDHISVTGRLNYQDWVCWDKYDLKLSISKRDWLVTICFAQAAGLYGIASLGNRQLDNDVLATLPTILCFCAWIFWPIGYLVLRRIGVYIRYDEENITENTALLTRDDISISGSNFTHSYKWPVISKVLSTHEGLFFIAGPKLWFFLPQRDIASHRLKERILERVKEANVAIATIP